ncbi:hypothetical protein [Ehrlichia minasensis]|nr:hypothetical protein [Ehrlichia minasensis]
MRNLDIQKQVLKLQNTGLAPVAVVYELMNPDGAMSMIFIIL